MGGRAQEAVFSCSADDAAVAVGDKHQQSAEKSDRASSVGKKVSLLVQNFYLKFT